MEFTPLNFVKNLIYIVRGELGLFFALGAIALSTIVLNRYFSDKED
ncbi:MAG: hypothetical protein K5908_08700 [Erysipelotrichaceae bacterium]|jgi:hypothetical protein|nr:hypothetical protein [Erysipelotrichaceae bacterium]